MNQLQLGPLGAAEGMTMKRVFERLGRVPFVPLVATLVLMVSYVVEVALAFAWFLRCLEIHSIFDRWLPGSAWYLLLLFVVALAAQGLWSMLVGALEGDNGSPRRARGAVGGVRILGQRAGNTTAGVVEAGIPRPAGKWGAAPREQP